DVKIYFESPANADFYFSINTLDRILYNLLSNALKYSNAGDTITVQVVKEDTGILLNVKDKGIGIPEAERQNIFKRYYRVLDNEQMSGSGIGLSLVKELVDLHKGSINVESSTQ